MYEKSKVTMCEHTFFFAHLYIDSYEAYLPFKDFQILFLYFTILEIRGGAFGNNN